MPHNQITILTVLRRATFLSRRDVATHSQLPPDDFAVALRDLIQQQLIAEVNDEWLTVTAWGRT